MKISNFLCFQSLEEIEANIYDGCGKYKNCVGAPLGCIAAANCLAVVALMPSSDKYQFEMLARNSQFVAFGISDDNRMVKFLYVFLDSGEGRGRQTEASV